MVGLKSRKKISKFENLETEIEVLSSTRRMLLCKTFSQDVRKCKKRAAKRFRDYICK